MIPRGPPLRFYIAANRWILLCSLQPLTEINALAGMRSACEITPYIDSIHALKHARLFDSVFFCSGPRCACAPLRPAPPQTCSNVASWPQPTAALCLAESVPLPRQETRRGGAIKMIGILPYALLGWRQRSWRSTPRDFGGFRMHARV